MLLNAGAVHHIGPNRLYVALARRLARARRPRAARRLSPASATARRAPASPRTSSTARTRSTTSAPPSRDARRAGRAARSRRRPVLGRLPRVQGRGRRPADRHGRRDQPAHVLLQAGHAARLRRVPRHRRGAAATGRLCDARRVEEAAARRGRPARASRASSSSARGDRARIARATCCAGCACRCPTISAASCSRSRAAASTLRFVFARGDPGLAMLREQGGSAVEQLRARGRARDRRRSTAPITRSRRGGRIRCCSPRSMRADGGVSPIASGAARLAAPGAVERGHMPALDGLRGIAILLVLAHALRHDRPAQPVPARSSTSRSTPAGSACSCSSCCRASSSPASCSTRASGARYFRGFFTRRVLRIFPLYYATLLVAFVIVPLVADVPAGHGDQPGVAVDVPRRTSRRRSAAASRRCRTSGRSPSRSSSTWCGRSSCSSRGRRGVLAVGARWWSRRDRRARRTCARRWGAEAAYTFTPCRMDALAMRRDRRGVACAATALPGAIARRRRRADAAVRSSPPVS